MGSLCSGHAVCPTIHAWSVPRPFLLRCPPPFSLAVIGRDFPAATGGASCQTGLMDSSEGGLEAPTGSGGKSSPTPRLKTVLAPNIGQT